MYFRSDTLKKPKEYTRIKYFFINSRGLGKSYTLVSGEAHKSSSRPYSSRHHRFVTMAAEGEGQPPPGQLRATVE